MRPDGRGLRTLPGWLLPSYLFYAGVDALILLGVARDLVVDRRVHPYCRSSRAGVGQAIATYTSVHEVPSWLRLAHAILGG